MNFIKKQLKTKDKKKSNSDLNDEPINNKSASSDNVAASQPSTPTASTSSAAATPNPNGGTVTYKKVTYDITFTDELLGTKFSKCYFLLGIN